MTDKNRKKMKKWIFPAGIFLLLFITETIIFTGASLSYLYFQGKKDIGQIEKYTVNYSSTLAEAFAGVAELSFRTKKYSALITLFHEKIEENTIDEAFFILADGRLIAHSNTTIEKGLAGNIANDEMSYNIDLLLRPVTLNSSELFLSPYNIINKEIPFSRAEREYIQKYYYRDINSSGWLFTRGVFVKGKPVGTVNFIISKDRIFNSVKDQIKKVKLAVIAVPVISFVISLLISLIVMFRYRSIQKISEKYSSRPSTGGETMVKGERRAPEPEDIDIFPELRDNPVEDDFEIILDDIPERPAREEIPALFPETGSLKGDESPLPVGEEKTSDDEYVTIELLGEIDEGETAKPELQLKGGARIYIAPVINTGGMNKAELDEIRDAIPVSRKR